MIRRKNSFGFIDFVKGKYSLSNILHIENSINQMADFEKQFILKNMNSFQMIWKQLYTCPPNFKTNKEYSSAFRKFEQLKQGININGVMKKTLVDFFESSTTNYLETEWEFPKGRKFQLESDLDCAKREFEEETGFPAVNIQVLENLNPINEIFMGSNYKAYKHTYFLALTNSKSNSDNFQVSEVSKVEWKTLDQCISCMRDYHFEKQNVIRHADQILKHLILEQTFQKNDSSLSV
jgi:8-oxo-dGTP pyrophosphatase MutT (NUDIX family)